VVNPQLTLIRHLCGMALLDDIPLFSMLKSHLGYLSDRQKLIAQNVANADTPGFTPQDLANFTTPLGSKGAAPLAMAPVTPAQTNPMHLAPPQSAASKAWQTRYTPDSETKLDGNQVVLEEQMVKMSDARGQYDAAIGFYEKSLAMLQTAIKAPGKPA
jgi:flagellar basal-body rod protein FlgB